mmetsp:Transcript_67940/g.211056  ORF Transcript_67940/g.211056 Transcript_67940/m.211056 type:complete len:145 (+) Transcript_67940:76-510(+)
MSTVSYLRRAGAPASASLFESLSLDGSGRRSCNKPGLRPLDLPGRDRSGAASGPGALRPRPGARAAGAGSAEKVPSSTVLFDVLALDASAGPRAQERPVARAPGDVLQAGKTRAAAPRQQSAAGAKEPQAGQEATYARLLAAGA